MDTRETNSPDYLSPELKNLDFAYFVGGMVTGFFFFLTFAFFFPPLTPDTGSEDLASSFEVN
jgi:hypothetical protein